MGAVRPARARRREAVGLRYRWRGNPRLHPRWHRGSSRNYQGSDRSRRLIPRRVYRGAQRMLTINPKIAFQLLESAWPKGMGEMGDVRRVVAAGWLTVEDKLEGP